MKGARTVREAQESRGGGFTIAGNQGVGKTSMAALFPKPIIIQVEEGVESIIDFEDVLVTDPIEDMTKVKDWLHRLLKEDHDRITAVVDSITAADTRMESEIVLADGSKTLNQVAGGYGAGHRMLAGEMRGLRQMAARLQRERGMHVVFVAHTEITTFQPEDDEAFNLLDLRMNPKSRPPFCDDVDVVAFMRLKRDSEKVEGKRRIATSAGRRELVCYAHAALASKNRIGIEEILPCPQGSNPILEIFERKRGKSEAKPKPETKEEQEKSRTQRLALVCENVGSGSRIIPRDFRCSQRKIAHSQPGGGHSERYFQKSVRSRESSAGQHVHAVARGRVHAEVRGHGEENGEIWQRHARHSLRGGPGVEEGHGGRREAESLERQRDRARHRGGSPGADLFRDGTDPHSGYRGPAWEGAELHDHA